MSVTDEATPTALVKLNVTVVAVPVTSTWSWPAMLVLPLLVMRKKSISVALALPAPITSAGTAMAAAFSTERYETMTRLPCLYLAGERSRRPMRKRRARSGFLWAPAPGPSG